MEDVKISIQETPNPNARKFATNHAVKAEGRMSFEDKDLCFDNELAKKLLSIDMVEQVHFFENIITVTKSKGEWDSLEPAICDVIRENIQDHDPYFEGKSLQKEEVPKKEDSEDLRKIDRILDDTIRYRLQMDGGDVELLRLDGKELHVKYLGACGSCPAALGGTLAVIEQVLRSEFDPQIRVIPE